MSEVLWIMDSSRDTITFQKASLQRLAYTGALCSFFLYFTKLMLFGPNVLLLPGVTVDESLKINFVDDSGNSYLTGIQTSSWCYPLSCVLTILILFFFLFLLTLFFASVLMSISCLFALPFITSLEKNILLLNYPYHSGSSPWCYFAVFLSCHLQLINQRVKRNDFFLGNYFHNEVYPPVLVP